MGLEIVRRGSGRPSLVRRGVASISPNAMIRVAHIDLTAVGVNLDEARVVILCDVENRLIGLEAPGRETWRQDNSRAIVVRGLGIPSIRATSALARLGGAKELRGYYRTRVDGATLIIEMSEKIAAWNALAVTTRGLVPEGEGMGKPRANRRGRP